MSVLVTGTRAPSVLHLARLLAQSGCEVIAAESLRYPLARGARFITKTLRHPAPNADPNGFRDWLLGTIKREGLSRIYPGCEEIFHVARVLDAAGLSELLYAPNPDLLHRAHDKFEFAELLREIRLPGPKTRLIVSPEQLHGLDADPAHLVFKPTLSRFGQSVFKAPSPKELDKIVPSGRRPWVAQDFIQGEEICLHAFGSHGRMGGWAAYRPTWRVGAGAGIYFAPERDPSIAGFIETFFQKTGWHGHVGFDLIREPGGRLMPIECNPRITSGIHFFTSGAQAMAGMLGISEAIPDDRPRAVKLAMRAFAWPQALRQGTSAQWRQDMAVAEDACAYGMQGAGLWRQLRLSSEFALRAVKARTPLLAATTSDIEWSGPPGLRSI